MVRSTAGFCCALVFSAALMGQAGALPAGPVPHPALQARSREMIRKVFEKDYTKTTPADKQALAKVLIAQARETKDDATARYVALTEAMDLAAGAGDAATAFVAIEELSSHYEVAPLELRRAALTKAHAASTTPADSETVMHLALQTADQAVQIDAFDAVLPLATIAEGAANKTRQVKVVASIQVKLAELRELAAEFILAREAFARLDKGMNDADAHLVIGRFYALHKGQWTLGLPHLATGSDAELKELAERELLKPADGFAQAALGDAWWEYGEKSSGLTRRVVQAHAVEIYTAARASIQGITLARIDSRLAAGTSQTQPSAVVSPQAAKSIDLLALITEKDAAQGTWQRLAGGLACDRSSYACLQLPYNVPEEYDLHATFTRHEGDGPIALLLVQGKRAFGFALDVKSEARFESIDKKAAKDNPTLVPVAISNGRRYAVAVEVRKDRVRAILDGKLLVEWKTDYKDMSRYSVWKLGDNTLCGIGANNARVLFEKLELVEITGKGKPTR